MAHKIIKVAFMPDFTPEFKSWIQNNINHEMENVDESSRQYELDQIVIELSDQEEKHARPLYVEDSILIAKLQYEQIDYVEF